MTASDPSPKSGQFTAVFTPGERAVAIAHESMLPDEIKSDIDTARKYAEGRSIRLEVISVADAEAVKQLVAVKLARTYTGIGIDGLEGIGDGLRDRVSR